MKKVSEFRLWVNQLYYSNRDERQSLNIDTFDVKEYFNEYKWWLKREFQYQKNRKKS